MEKMRKLLCVLFGALAVGSGLWLGFYLALQTVGPLLPALDISFCPNSSSSVGIIGGADGPTAIFVTGPAQRPGWDLILMGLLLILGIGGWLWLRKKK